MASSNQTITIPNAGGAINAYLAQPDGSGAGRKAPGIVIIHEAYGLNDNIKSIADRFANEGYVALAVDLFGERNRMVCMFQFFSGMFLNSLNHRGIRDLKVALGYLENHPNVDSNRLGAIGFCIGGGFAIAWACTDPRLKVIAPFYGSNPRPFDAVARVCPVVGSYPEDDLSAGAGRKLDAALTEQKIAHDIKIYPGAKHSFFNSAGRNHNPEASQDAWMRTLVFFNQQLA